MSGGSRLPFPEQSILDTARAMLASRNWKLGQRELPHDVPLRIGGCVALRRAADASLIAYQVMVMVDPKLGVP